MKFLNVSQADTNTIAFTVHGDGTSTVLHCNLSTHPFGIDFQGKLPSSLEVNCGDPDGPLTATASVALDGNSHAIMTVTFNQAPPLYVETDGTTPVTLNITPAYDSE